MATSQPSRYLIHHIMYCFFLQHETAAEAQRLICAMYGQNIVSLSDCEIWFARFKPHNVDGTLRMIYIEELATMRKENPHRTQEELAQQLQSIKTLACDYVLKQLGELGEL